MSTYRKPARRMAALFLACSLLLTACGHDADPSDSSDGETEGPAVYGTWAERQQAFKDPNGRLMVCAHRGFWSGEQPENSLAAFEAAFEIGVDMIEIDIQRTADGQYVLCHDTSLTRTTNITQAWMDGTITGDLMTYNIEELTLDQIKTLRLKSGDGGADATLTDEQVPTLREAIEACRGKVYLLFDKGMDYLDDICALLDELDAWDFCLFQAGGNYTNLQLTLREQENKYGVKPLCGWFFQEETPQLITEKVDILSTDPAKNPPFIYVHPNNGVSYQALQADINNIEHAMDPDMMAALKGRSRLFLNTLDSWAEGVDSLPYWEKLYAAGYNIIQSDKPQEVCAYIRSLLGVETAQTGA